MNSAIEQLKKELPFDLFGRYAKIYEIISGNHIAGRQQTILDVGGRGNILRKFFAENSDYNVFFLDPLIESVEDNFIEGDGCNIPLDDDSFDWVVSADVFEHIEPASRERFLAENLRVARRGVVLVAPFNSREVALAENNANSFYKELFATDHPWLVEHLRYGLPEPEMVERYLNSKGLTFELLYNNNIKIWQLLLGMEFICNHQDQEELLPITKQFNYYYNNFIYPNDSSPNSYRRIYFIKKDAALRADCPVSGDLSEITLLNVYKEYTRVLNKIAIKADQVKAALRNCENNDSTQIVELLKLLEEKDLSYSALMDKFDDVNDQLEQANEQKLEFQNSADLHRQLFENIGKDLQEVTSSYSASVAEIKEATNQAELHKTLYKNIIRDLDGYKDQVKIDIANLLRINDSERDEKKQLLELVRFMESSKFWKMRAWDSRVKFAIFSPCKFVKKYFNKIING